MKIRIIAITLLAIIGAIIFLGKCNCTCKKKPPEPPATVQQLNDLYNPLTQRLEREVQQLKDSIATLQGRIHKLLPQKQKTKQQAATAIAKGKQTNNCDTLRAAFNELTQQHDAFVMLVEKEADYKSGILLQQEQIITHQQSLIELERSKFQNLAANYQGLQVLYDRQARDLAKAERKMKRRGRANKIFIAAAAVAAGIILLQ